MAKGPGAKTEYFLEEVHHMVSRYFLPKKCLELHFFKKGRHRCERGRSGGSGGDGGGGGDQVWGASEGGQDKQVCGLQEGTILFENINMMAVKKHAWKLLFIYGICATLEKWRKPLMAIIFSRSCSSRAIFTRIANSFFPGPLLISSWGEGRFSSRE